MDKSPNYRYLPENNPENAHIPGVPLRDLSAAEVAALHPWLRTAVATCRFYRAVPADAPPTRRRAGPSETKEA